MSEAKKTGLELLRQPFEKHQISKLPKPTKAQTEEVKSDYKKGIRCQLCGAWHHKDVVHLDYVGHAALTDRLLECDPNWNWEPLSFGSNGSPSLDDNGGMWIKLTICGVTRLGYGFADGKEGGNAIKETIGDALRNAGMRFGAALDLWHKGDLHRDDDPPNPEQEKIDPKKAIEGAKKENVIQPIQPSGSYVLKGVYLKGRKLIDISNSELEGCLKYYRDLNKTLTGDHKVSFDIIEAYLAKITKKAEPPVVAGPPELSVSEKLS